MAVAIQKNWAAKVFGRLAFLDSLCSATSVKNVKAKRYKVKKAKPYKPHADVLRAAEDILSICANLRIGRPCLWMGAMILSAFAFEGCLNYLGKKLIPSRAKIERRSAHNKIRAIAQKVGFVFDGKTAEFQMVEKLYQFRNSAARLKSEPAILQHEYETDMLDSTVHERLKSEIDEFCTEHNAKRCIEAVKSVILRLHRQAKDDRGNSLYPSVEGLLVTVI